MHESMIQLNGKQGIVESVLLTSPSMNPIFSCLMSTMTDDDKKNAIWYNVLLETNKYIEFPSTYLRRMFCVDHGRHDNNILAMLRANPVANDDDTAAAAAATAASKLSRATNTNAKATKAPTTKRTKKATVAKGARTTAAASKAMKKKKPVKKKAPKNTTAMEKNPPPQQQPTSDDAKMIALMKAANITDIAHAMLFFSKNSNGSSNTNANASSSLKISPPSHAATGEALVPMDIVPPSTPYATGTITKKYFKEYRAWYKGTIIEYNSTTYLYKVGYEDGDHEELEHHEINTEPFPSHPLYVLGMQFKRFLVRKSTEEEIGWMIGTIKSQFYYIPPRRSNTRSNNRWRYRIEYEDNDQEDLDEFEITETIVSSQRKRESDGNDSSNRRWSREEHIKLVKGLARYGMDDKKNLAALITTRTARSVGAYITRHHKELVEEAKKYKNNNKADKDDDDDEVNEDDGDVSNGEESVSSSSKSVSDDDSDSEDESSMDEEERERRKRIPHWTGKEHNQFINGSRNYGYGNLKEIDEANCIPTRTYDQLLRYFRWYITDLTKNKRLVLNWSLKGNINGLPGKEWVWSDDEDKEEEDDGDGDADDEKEEEGEESRTEEIAKASDDEDGHEDDGPAAAAAFSDDEKDEAPEQEQEDDDDDEGEQVIKCGNCTKWTQKERKRISRGLVHYGVDREKLADLIPTRTPGSVFAYVSRYHDKLLKESDQYEAEDFEDDDEDEKLRTGRWTSAEHRKCAESIISHG
jgi:hypothetical protein